MNNDNISILNTGVRLTDGKYGYIVAQHILPDRVLAQRVFQTHLGLIREHDISKFAINTDYKRKEYYVYCIF